MHCPSCRASNHARRRYCGKCGCNFAPACQGCGFANDATDRFCGGCGDALRAGAVAIAAPSGALAPAAIATPAVASSPWQVGELAGLFAPVAPVDDGPQLPESGVGQDDLDRLFGGAP